MIPKFFSDDFAWYAFRYFDGDGNVILPDQDASLIWEFYDSLNVLQFTATLISTPPIEQDSDIDGDFQIVRNVPLTGWNLGIVTAKAFSNKGGQAIQPDPLLTTAFEIVQQQDGYCSPQDVIDYSGVQAADLERQTGTELNSLLQNWILEAGDIIDKFVNQTWTPADSAPLTIKNTCKRMVSNMVIFSVQRRKNPIIQIGEFNIRLLEDIMFTDDIKATLMLQRKNKPLGIGLGVYTKENSELKEED